MVDNKMLLTKLYSYGIRGTSHEWLRSYLQNRKQICSINGRTSIAREVGHAVPQGSNLGPILFLLCINDLPNCLKTTKAKLYLPMTQVFPVRHPIARNFSGI